MGHLRAPAAPDPQAQAGPESLARMSGLAESLLENPVAHAILDLLPGYALILTQDRQVLAGDRDVLAELGLTTPESLQGLRPGELFRCIPVQDGFSRSRQFWVRSAPLRMGGQELLLFIFKEITEQKRREALEQVFLHDLLNLVGGLSSIAGRVRGPEADPEACSGQIQELSRQLAEEIQSQRLLLGAEPDRRAAQSREVQPAEILDRLGRLFRASPAAEGRRLEIRPGTGEPFVCDPVLLTRVLVNLVKNALEATPRGGTVRVWHERRPNRRGFVVENPGVIPEQTASRVFERCFSTKACQGRGLGSFGAKLLGEQLLGGEVGFAPHGGTSTRFFIWMPEAGACPGADPARAALSGPPQAQAPEGADTVLVVDDSKTLCRLLGNLLCPRYRVLTAENGEDGFTLAVQCSPDLILLDIMMPDLDGLAVCRRLKGDSRTREIPVLFLTALGGEAEEMRALEAGGIDFILKPISPPVLAARVRNQLQLKHQQDRLRNLSLLDGLTGIANRRRFDQYLEMEWQRCSRNGQPLSLVMGDVDFFKAYNDGYGHSRGDDCLRAVAKVFGMALRRPADLAARFGGEEFICVLPETDQEGARNVADQIMAQMEDLAMPHAYSAIARRVTVSVGIATAPRPSLGRSWKTLVEEVDMWMYDAKGKGRNRISGCGLE
ncbi:MAG: diguanylate cyclase [Holophaga sp.]|nr:diguanylate cyclase [Holophaga sp.]